MPEQKQREQLEARKNEQAENMSKPEALAVGPEQHSFEVKATGLPGQEVYTADTIIKNNQVEVSFLKPGELIPEKRQIIEGHEQTALSSMQDENLTEKGQQAKEAVDLSTKEAADIQDISALFDQNINKILKINKGFEHLEFPEQGMHFLITQADEQLIKAELHKLGYNLREVAGIGFVAEKELTTLSFVFANEKEQPKSKEKN